MNDGELSAPLKEKFEDFPLDGQGTLGMGETSLVFRTLIDAEKASRSSALPGNGGPGLGLTVMIGAGFRGFQLRAHRVF